MSLTRRAFIVSSAMALLALPGCTSRTNSTDADSEADSSTNDTPSSQGGDSTSSPAQQSVDATFTQGSRTDRGFVVDDSLVVDGRTLHFSLHVPDSYDGSTPYALYVACPGWEGLYFQGVGANLQEDYPFVANDYIPDMIVASLQLDDWGQQSANDAITITEWLLGSYNVDQDRVYLSGCSGGGETISLVLGMRPDLYRRALHTISRWDGNIDVLADSEVPVYMTIGENDDYYGPDPDRQAFQQIGDAYRRRGLSEDRINELITLDVKPTSYFTERGYSAGSSQHGAGGYLFAHDSQIMGWLFS